MSLKGIARQTLSIIESGRYTVDGRSVSVQPALDDAVRGTRTWTPEALAALPDPTLRHETRISVTTERTQAAARRLVVDEGEEDVVLLSFASARNVCGGFLNGARAQEEDLARCSGLYACLSPQGDYYAANREESTLLYTDHMIHAPRVPFFRAKNRDLLPTPYCASVITAPAPNAGQALRRDPNIGAALTVARRRRADRVLRLAAAEGHPVVVLGAWGCGVFQNSPAETAAVFHELLAGTFAGVFSRVVLAVYDPSKRKRTLQAFQAAFTAQP